MEKGADKIGIKEDRQTGKAGRQEGRKAGRQADKQVRQISEGQIGCLKIVHVLSFFIQQAHRSTERIMYK